MKDRFQFWLALAFFLALLFGLAGIFLPKLACAVGEYPIKSKWWQGDFYTPCGGLTSAKYVVMGKMNYVEGSTPCAYLDSVKKLNPNFGWTVYYSMVDAPAHGSAEETWIINYCDSLGAGSFAEESCYYHYWNNTSVLGQPITGWKNLDDSAKYHSRVPFAINLGRFFRRHDNSIGRQLSMHHIVKNELDSLHTPNNDFPDGIFYDNGGYTSMSSWFQLNSGETLYEKEGGVKITSKSVLDQHEWDGRHIFYRTMYDSMFINGHLWSKDLKNLLIELNVGQHWFGDYYKDDICTRTDNELLHNPFAMADNGSGRPWHLAKKQDSIQAQAHPISYEWETDDNGAGYYMPLVGDTVPPSARFSGLSAQFKKDQINLDNLAFFYVVRRESTSFRTRLSGLNPGISGWDTLAWHPLFDTLDRFTYPIDTCHQVRMGIDSLGDSAGVWGRSWTNGNGGVDTLLAVVRCRHLWNQTAGQNTAFKFDLPGSSYKAIDMHGNLGNALDSAWLRNGQGAFFIRYGSGGSPQPNCDVSPTSLNFGQVYVDSSKSMTFRIKNAGGGTLSGTVNEAYSNFVMTGQPVSYFLAAGESLVVEIIFTPTAVQTYNGSVSNTNETCASVSFSGSGVAAPPVTPSKGKRLGIKKR